LEEDRVSAQREIEGGKEIVTFNLPGIISAHKGLNIPRYRSLKGIMRAKKIPIDIKKIEFNEEKISLQKLEYPPTKKAGKIVGKGVAAVPELVNLLQNEAKVI
jgi:electron transfer flavoprotein beta subunit